MKGRGRRWLAFVRERYEPGRHMAMAAAFAVGNAGVAAATAGVRPGPGAVGLAGLVCLLFFFRLRLFDEIKDYETDLVANPERPLPRGVVSLREARAATWIVAGAECAVVAAADWRALPAWALAALYSVAMYHEFWVGAWLRPRMELYAVTHTVVAALLGIAVCSLVLGAPLDGLPRDLWMLAPLNWALFNVFEFSRKTFAPAEERPGVESYSSRRGPRGAVLLTLAWVALALASLVWAGARAVPGMPPLAGAGLAGLVSALLVAPFLVARSAGAARLARAAMPGWAALLYLSMGLAGFGATGGAA